MGKRILMIVLVLGLVGMASAESDVPWADAAQGAVLVPSMNPMNPVNPWGLDDPQPDSIWYDNGVVYFLSGGAGTFYPAMRFTPLAEFDLVEVSLILNYISHTHNYTIWVTGVSGGAPDPANILMEVPDLVPQNGWQAVHLPDTLTFALGEDFCIVYGETESATSGIGWFPNCDDVPQGRSFMGTLPFPANPTPVFSYGFSWCIRARGIQAESDIVDVGVINVDNTTAQWFICEGDNITYRAEVENFGNVAIPSFDVTWRVEDLTPTQVFTTTSTGFGPLAVGATMTVTATAAWTASTAGEYMAVATVTALGDAVPENDSLVIEQQVYDPAVSTMLDYEEAISGNLIQDPGEGKAIEFTPCSYPAEVTHIEVEVNQDFGLTTLQIVGDDGLDNPDPSNVLFDSTFTTVTGVNSIAVGSVPIVSGSFYVAYFNAEAVNTASLPLGVPPHAGTNTTMSTTFTTTNSGVSWTADPGVDHPLRARIVALGGTVRDIRVDWMTFPGFFGPGSEPFEGQIQVSNQGTDPDTFDVSLTIEDTTFARSVVFSETQTVTNLAVGDSATLTYGSYNFPGIGEYILTAEAIVPGDASPGNNTLATEHQTCLYPSELTYDDGTFESGWAFFDPGNFWGARFDPPFYPCKITDMRLNFSTVPVGFDNARAQIIGPDGTTLLYDVEDPAVVVGWNSYNPGGVLVLSSFFYAGTEWITGAPDAPYFSTDDSDPISLMARQRIAGVWYFDVEEAGVRVTVDAAVMSPIVIARTGGSRNLDMQLTWDFAGTTGETWYFIYESNEPYGTYVLADSVVHPAQTWDTTNLPQEKRFYYVTFGDASGSRDSTLPGQYLWQPFEMTVSDNSIIEPGVIRAPGNVADRH